MTQRQCTNYITVLQHMAFYHILNFQDKFIKQFAISKDHFFKLWHEIFLATFCFKGIKNYFKLTD